MRMWLKRKVKRRLQRHGFCITTNRNVHQILFTDPGAASPSGYVCEAIQSVRKAFPRHRHVVWDLDDATAFIAEHFTPDVEKAFRCLRPYAYKADLFKYCVLQVHGGWYVDAGVTMLRSPLVAQFAQAPTPPAFVLFRSTGPADASWNCSLALLYAEPGHSVFTTAINEIVDNCKQERYGANFLCPTMSPFGRALAIHNVVDRIELGLVVDVEGEAYNRAYRHRQLGLIAARRPAIGGRGAGDMTGTGLSGTNNYAEMWHQQRVFTAW